ncbi:hypothetical protein GCM10010401_12730 [Rarobacter faecitabidus]|uniref:Transglutaminase-like putative cysteine protease n=1 Tax=Rarobacter faecitabidus TaxID=13243 RepID=A0A542Z8K4_RARFA|nr:transglutaminase domain-containing protein [Rarobacter faecitabidus]TQL56666.1 transglutaminase-like putative cysteine protease [Rarobacter faecitabidus]
MIARRAALVTVRTLLLLAVTIFSMHALTPLLDGSGSFATATVSLLIVAGITLGSRLALLTGSWRDQRFICELVPLGAGVASALIITLVRFGNPGGGALATVDHGDGLGGLLGKLADPVTQRIQGVADTLSPLGNEIKTGSIPVRASEAITAAVVIGVVLIYVIAEPLVVGLGAGWLAILPLGALWSAPLIFVREVPWPALAGSLVAYLALLCLRRTDIWFLTRRLTAALVAGALLVAVGMAGGTLALHGQEPHALQWGGGAAPQNIGPFALTHTVDVGKSLTERSEVVAYVYRDDLLLGEDATEEERRAVEDIRNSPMRITTSIDFDGQTWFVGGRQGDSVIVSAGGMVNLPDDASGDDNAAAEPTRGFTRHVALNNLDDTLLPTVLSPFSVDGATSRFTASSGELALARSAGTTNYSLTSYVRPWTADELREVSQSLDLSGLDPGYTTVPALAHASETAALAARVTAGKDTPYDQLVALQEYFRDPANFTYSTDLDPVLDGDPVWSFLQSRRGYCVQFATSMIVMARSLGLPARFAQGFLPGTRAADGTIQVTGDRAHAWPEFYFGSLGWVRFEPTPATQSSAAPSWTREPSESSPSPSPRPSRTPTPTPSRTTTPAPTTPSSRPSASPAGRAANGRVLLALGLAGVLAAGGVVAFVLVRRRRRAAIVTIEHQWKLVVRAAARAGLQPDTSTTARQFGDRVLARYSQARVEQSMPRHQSPSVAATARALDVLVQALELARYSDPGQAADRPAADEASERAQSAAATIVAALGLIKSAGEES